jgi:hypothetical protein
MSYNIHAEHSTVISRPDDKFGWFGFPNITKLDDGNLMLSCSGLRLHHMCPFGKAVIMYGKPDAGKWGLPQTLRDSHLDDRDCSVLNMGGGKLMAAWYNWKNEMYFKRPFYQMLNDSTSNEDFILITSHLRSVDLATQEKDYGSWVCVSDDNGMTWREPTRCKVASFHGPMMLNDGSLLYLGKDNDGKETGGVNMAYKSTDDGVNWEHVSDIPILEGEGLSYLNFVDPHGVQLPGGRIICQIRYQNGANPEKYGRFSVFQTESDDNGKTWTKPRPLNVNGSPPHLIRHSSGALVSVYGRRDKPLGESAMVSLDDGASWITEIILRDDAKHADLGFPSSVELPDGSIYTVYYQFNERNGVLDKKASIMATKWRIDDILKRGNL